VFAPESFLVDKKIKAYFLMPAGRFSWMTLLANCEFLREIYIFPGSVCLFCCREYVDRSWKYINRSQTHDVEFGTEAAQFPEKENINGIFLAVHGENL
jgi:hypothetical protein